MDFTIAWVVRRVCDGANMSCIRVLWFIEVFNIKIVIKDVGMRKTTIAAIIVTVIWLGSVAAYVILKWSIFVTMEPSAVGDFLAGTISPLAFFWLIAGYMQQGHELKLNTQSLLEQHQEMKLQRIEMARQASIAEQSQTIAGLSSVFNLLKK